MIEKENPTGAAAAAGETENTKAKSGGKSDKAGKGGKKNKADKPEAVKPDKPKKDKPEAKPKKAAKKAAAVKKAVKKAAAKKAAKKAVAQKKAKAAKKAAVKVEGNPYRQGSAFFLVFEKLRANPGKVVSIDAVFKGVDFADPDRMLAHMQGHGKSGERGVKFKLELLEGRTLKYTK